jgi:hypothetical protein
METPTLPAQSANQASIHEDMFNRQKAYFATNITKSFEWRLDQLDRLARLLSEHAALGEAAAACAWHKVSNPL